MRISIQFYGGENVEILMILIVMEYVMKMKSLVVKMNQHVILILMQQMMMDHVLILNNIMVMVFV